MNQKKLFVIVFILSCLTTRAVSKAKIGSTQTVRVKGKLVCQGKPYTYAILKLWDNDTFDPDDLMGKGYTDDEGNFDLFGSTESIAKIDPEFRIKHECPNSYGGELTIVMAKQYIAKYPETPVTCETGEIELSSDKQTACSA